MGYVFISYSTNDKLLATQIREKLIANGVNVWIDIANIMVGESWRKATSQAIENADAFILIYSTSSIGSVYVQKELSLARINQINIIPIVPSESHLAELEILDDIKQLNIIFANQKNMIEKLMEQIPEEAIGPPDVSDLEEIIDEHMKTAKGYFFISYSIEDLEFAYKLRKFLADKGYAYWDYQEADRKYDMPFHLEIEGAIQKASAVISIVSPDWKVSKWATREYLFSEQISKTNFVCIIRDVGPTLLYADKTFIEFFNDEEKGFDILDKALRRAGLID